MDICVCMFVFGEAGRTHSLWFRFVWCLIAQIKLSVTWQITIFTLLYFSKYCNIILGPRNQLIPDSGPKDRTSSRKCSPNGSVSSCNWIEINGLKLTAKRNKSLPCNRKTMLFLAKMICCRLSSSSSSSSFLCQFGKKACSSLNPPSIQQSTLCRPLLLLLVDNKENGQEKVPITRKKRSTEKEEEKLLEEEKMA